MYQEIYQLLISTYKKVSFIYIKEIAYNYYYYDHCYYLLCVWLYVYEYMSYKHLYNY